MSPRGDSTNLRNYARALREFLKIESVLTFNQNNLLNHSKTIDAIKDDGFQVISYKDATELNAIAKNNSITHAYFMVEGKYQGLWVKDAINLIHSVFNYYEPYGDKYAYVSEWLYKQNIKSKVRINSKVRAGLIQRKSGSPYGLDPELKKGFVPHCVYPEDGIGERFLKKFNIPPSKFLVGRIGGFDQFSDKEARKAVFEIIKKRKDIFFIFVNTKNFGNHSNVIYIDWLSYKDKWDFYDACDLFWNGRLMGESFGFSIVEPLMINKPVIAPSLKRNKKMDQNHIEILDPLNLLYSNKDELVNKTVSILEEKTGKITEYRRAVEKYKPEIIANQFKDFFLKE
jgi:hypothetical protein